MLEDYGIHICIFFFLIPKSKYPSCPGHEVVGVVEKVGPAVTKFKIGDRVGCNP